MARVLVVGGGGREHALAWKLAQSPQVQEVLVAPGNDGMRPIVTLVPAIDIDGWVAAAKEHAVDLVVVGPEAPLVDGLADRLRADGFAVFGPDSASAMIEGDKDWAKQLFAEASIPTAEFATFDALDPALAHVAAIDGPCVVKATGLAAGKGVTVCDHRAQAEAAVRDCLGGAFGSAGSSVLIEERLEGPELSVFAVTDGEHVAWFEPSRDHKRLGEGDTGPNTGGMGAYTPVADSTPELMERIRVEILEPTIAALRSRGLDYRGLLYAGLMLTSDGPKVLEYNCRFGDPETQVVLPAFDGDLYPLLLSAARGALDRTGALPSRGAAVGIVLASAGYPASSTSGVEIPALSRVDDDALVFHAATRLEDGVWRTNGGRVLSGIGQAPGLAAARLQARTLVDELVFDGAQHRRDIARQEASEENR
jgi:phosphoribosylamine--glycine ligase